MDSNQTNSSIVLDLAWSHVDAKSQGFIYAKDFPELLREINEILNRGKSPNERVSLVSTTGEEIIRSFGKDKEFFKVYKDDFKELFDGLVGMSFKSAVENCVQDGMLKEGSLLEELDGFNSVNKNSPNSEFQKELNFLRKQASRLSKENSEKEQDITMRDEIIRDLQEKNNSSHVSVISPQRIKGLRTDIKKLEEELKFREDIIREKDRELLKLTKDLSEYKDKYKFLEREFNFYKDYDVRKHDSGTTQKISSVDNTKHQFIISELTRKIDEQSKTINELRFKVKQPMTKSSSPTNDFKSRSINKHMLSTFLKFSLGVVSFLFILRMLSLISSMFSKTQSSTVPNSVLRLSWWDQNWLLSKLHWLLRDGFEKYQTNDHYNESINSKYESLFGI